MSIQNASQATTSYCFRCQHHPGPDDEPLKRCSRCHARHYCSTDCQRFDWTRHKSECRTLAAGGEIPTVHRTTVRLRGPLRRDGAALPVNPDVIYYLKTSMPHIQDVSISGPYYPLDKVVDQLRIRMPIEESTGGPMLEELIANNALLNLQHFNAPLPGGNIMRFQLLKETNAAVASLAVYGLEHRCHYSNHAE